jgi:hypothetical protein
MRLDLQLFNTTGNANNSLTSVNEDEKSSKIAGGKSAHQKPSHHIVAS